MNELLKDDADFRWTDLTEASFIQLKKALMEAPVLMFPREQGKFAVSFDASNFAVGALLEQEDEDGNFRPIEYASRTLTTTERGYYTMEKELLAYVFGISKFSHYLRHRQFDVYTDH